MEKAQKALIEMYSGAYRAVERLAVQEKQRADKFDKAAQRETNIATAKNFGVKDPAAIIDTYEKAVEKWRARSKEIGRDIDKFAAVIESEIFEKVDLSKL